MSNNSATKWPVIAGSYQVGNPDAPVAVCTLTSERLMGPLAGLPGVAIAGMVYTANLGITRIIVNITANPSIRFLLICGRDSQLFMPGQSLVALADHGIDDQQRILGATGYDPVLPTLAPDQIRQFREQVEVVDWTGEEDLEALRQRISELSARNLGLFKTEKGAAPRSITLEEFVPIRPGGQREPLIYDPKGYFVISVEPEKEEIVLRHYLSDHTPSHEMRGRGATSMLLGLLREGLVTQLSHAGYLGEELAKAQTALQFRLRYDQDRPLRPREPSVRLPPEGSAQQADQAAPNSPTKQAIPSMPRITVPMTWKQMQMTIPDSVVDVVLTVTQIGRPEILGGTFLEADEAEPFTAFRRTSEQIEVHWTSMTRFAMGAANDLVVGALVRARGRLKKERVVQADQLVILTRTARIL